MNGRLLLAGSVRAFGRQKLKSGFMGLGIVVGVAALVVMRSMGSGAEQEMQEKVRRMFGSSSVIISNGAGAVRGGTRRPGKLTIEDLEAIDGALDQIVDWDPTVIVGDREVRYSDRDRNLTVFGQSERAESVWERGVVEGEYFSAADVRSAARVALLGGKTAKSLFGDEDPVGRQIRIDRTPFRVKGVLEAHGIDPHGWDRDDEVHVPVTTLMRRLVSLETIGMAKLTVAPGNDLDDTAERVAAILRSRHGLADDVPDDFSIHTPVQVREAVAEANRVLAVYLPATAGIALLVAAIVIANVMLGGVRERIPEIGLRKAVGATARQIGAQFLLESVALTGTAGVVGVGLGAAILLVAARPIAPDSIVLGLLAALGVGVLAGFLPARRAASLEPVDALR